SEGLEITRTDLPESLQKVSINEVAGDMPSSLHNLERMHILSAVSVVWAWHWPAVTAPIRRLRVPLPAQQRSRFRGKGVR
ncbi:hypothetical protein, partial [Pantoea agglomerans]|uniref:hypothetical protein n=1 Tax=Enterobacter agglomerans TaxID=549 RepID=UPI001A8EA055